MPETDWRSVAAFLRADVSGPTPAQTEFAHSIGLELDPSTPRAVATALMLCRLREPIGLPVSGEPKEQQLEYLHELAEETGSPMPADLTDRTVADAWIAAMHDKRAVMSLEQLRPEPGDVVQIPPFAGQELRIVASITSDSLLYFRGGPGQKIRPHRAIMAARKSDPNYANAAGRRPHRTTVRDLLSTRSLLRPVPRVATATTASSSRRIWEGECHRGDQRTKSAKDHHGAVSYTMITDAAAVWKSTAPS
jgi:hypothetical protein